MKVQIIECLRGYQAEVHFLNWTCCTNPTLSKENALKAAEKLSDRLGMNISEVEYDSDIVEEVREHT